MMEHCLLPFYPHGPSGFRFFLNMTKSIPRKERETLVALLKETRNAAQVARETGHNARAVEYIARQENIRLYLSPFAVLLKDICGAQDYRRVAEIMGITERTLAFYLNKLEIYAQSIRKNTIPKLRGLFPEKTAQILELDIMLACEMRASVSQIKRGKGKIENDFRGATGLLIREMHEACGRTVEQTQEMLKTPVVKKNLKTIVTGDTTLALSIHRDAARECAEIFSKIEREKSAPYVRMLEKTLKHYII